MAVVALAACGSESGRECENDFDCREPGICVEGACVVNGDDGGTQSDGGTGASMVLVPPGAFWMGCNDEVDAECNSNEYPYHEVTLSAYRIDRTEVTVAAYAACFDSGGCTEPDSGNHCNWGRTDYEDHPVNCVDWQQAMDYWAWAGKRLPTEAEWEKAGRGTDGRKYPWGTNEVACARANYGGLCVGETAPVGSYPTGMSPYAARDMAGNVWEWVADWYDENYYGSSPAADPQGPATGSTRVVRGGSWYDHPRSLRASFRVRNDPTYRYDTKGFRCASDE